MLDSYKSFINITRNRIENTRRKIPEGKSIKEVIDHFLREKRYKNTTNIEGIKFDFWHEGKTFLFNPNVPSLRMESVLIKKPEMEIHFNRDIRATSIERWLIPQS